MVREDMLPGCTLTTSRFWQARDRRVCQPCVVGRLRRVSHPLKSTQPVRVLTSVSMDLCSLPIGADAGMRYIATHIDKATHYDVVVSYCSSWWDCCGASVAVALPVGSHRIVNPMSTLVSTQRWSSWADLLCKRTCAVVDGRLWIKRWMHTTQSIQRFNSEDTDSNPSTKSTLCIHEFLFSQYGTINKIPRGMYRMCQLAYINYVLSGCITWC